MATLQVVILLISGCFLDYGPQISSAMEQQKTHKDVYKTLCKNVADICPCAAKHLIVTETGNEQAKPWICGSTVPLNRLTKLPTIKPPRETKIDEACPFMQLFNVVMCNCGRRNISYKGNKINLF